MKWASGAREGVVLTGGQGGGNGLSQLSNPRGVLVDRLGTIYVAEQDNQRVMHWLKGVTQGSVVVGENGQARLANQFHLSVGLFFN
jgi:hypothetical protein